MLAFSMLAFSASALRADELVNKQVVGGLFQLPPLSSTALKSVSDSAWRIGSWVGLTGSDPGSPFRA